jgi:hypothetical protein
LVMNINMPASVLLLVWSIAIAYFCWNETDRKL